MSSQQYNIYGSSHITNTTVNFVGFMSVRMDRLIHQFISASNFETRELKFYVHTPHLMCNI